MRDSSTEKSSEATLASRRSAQGIALARRKMVGAGGRIGARTGDWLSSGCPTGIPLACSSTSPARQRTRGMRHQWPRAQQISDKPWVDQLHRRLDAWAQRYGPFLADLHWHYHGHCSVDRAEYAADVVFGGRPELARIYEPLTRLNGSASRPAVGDSSSVWWNSSRRPCGPPSERSLKRSENRKPGSSPTATASTRRSPGSRRPRSCTNCLRVWLR